MTGEAFGEVVDIGCAAVASLLWRCWRHPWRHPCGASIAKADIWSREGVPHAVGRSAQSCAIWRRTTTCPRRPRCCWSTFFYQLEPVVQIALLRAAARAAQRRVLIRTLDPDLGMRSTLTLRLERLMQRLSPIPAGMSRRLANRQAGRDAR